MDTFKPAAHSLQPLTNSSRTLTQDLRRSTEKAAFATERARLLLGQFRRGEANDPATFITSVAAVLARYPEDVIAKVTDPRTGLALKTDWLPTIREIGVACDELAELDNAKSRREKDLASQLQRRVEDEKVRTAEERGRVQRKLEELRDARDRASGRQTATEQRAEAEVALARLLAEANAGPSARPPMVISDELRQLIGLRREAAE